MGPSIILAPIQLPAALGEWASQFTVLGAQGMWRAASRKRAAQGQSILKSYKHFSGDSLGYRLTIPGNDIGDHIGNLIWSALVWTRCSLRGNLLLAKITDEEYAVGKISIERLVQIKMGSLGSLGQLSGILKIIISVLMLALVAGTSGKRDFALALALAPLSRILIDLWEYKEDFSSGMGSIFFKQYVGVFKLLSTVAGAVLWYTLYKFSPQSDSSGALRHFVSASILQVPLYIVLKLVLPYEILLIPFVLFGVGLAFRTFIG
jgi:hypothetical protein